jgi:transcription initiation factor TFIIE subunit alpha
MQIELLKELVKTIAGKNSETIIDILQDKKDVNEFKIAEKLKLTINQTRNILYKLFANEIASFIRKKDKKKGWYIYYWTFNIPKALGRFIILKKKEISDMRNIISSYENKHFYFCPACSIELNEENSLIHNFICPECGKLLQFDTHEKKIQELKHKIEQAEQQLKKAENEYAILAEEKIKKYEKMKLTQRKERINLRKKLKKKLGRKLNKKTKKAKKKAKKKGKKKGKR